MNDSYFSVIEYSIKALECSYLITAADGYLNNDNPVNKRFDDNYNLIKLTGNSLPWDFRIPNIIILLVDTNLYEPYKVRLDEMSDEFYVTLPDFINRFNIWGPNELEKLYEGNFNSPNPEKRNELYNEYMKVNSFLCAPFEIEFE